MQSCLSGSKHISFQEQVWYGRSVPVLAWLASFRSHDYYERSSGRQLATSHHDDDDDDDDDENPQSLCRQPTCCVQPVR
jgi:hypothetical protein